MGSFPPPCASDCWIPGAVYSDLCEEAASNAGAMRKLLWHGGGAAFLDEPDHDLSVGSDFRGDGGTVHDSDLTGSPTLGERACPAFMLLVFFGFLCSRLHSHLLE